MRAHSSLTASGSAWLPPPLPACGGWTGSAGAWVCGAEGDRAARCVRRAGCPGGRDWARHCGSLVRNCSRRWGPQRRPPRCLEHHLPHCNTQRHTAALRVSLLSHFPEGFVFQHEARDRWKKWTLILLAGINMSDRIYSSSLRAAGCQEKAGIIRLSDCISVCWSEETKWL